MNKKTIVELDLNPLYHPPISYQQLTIIKYFISQIQALDGVEQNSRYHPEGDALYHSLQVFELAYQQSQDVELWLAALLHDIGKGPGRSSLSCH